MDKVDSELLSLLRVNARTSTSELARKLGVSRSTIQSRIHRLEAKGVIEGYSVLYGPAYNGRLVSAHVLIRVEQKLTEKSYSELQKLSAVKALYTISGDYDLVAVISAQTTEELSWILDDIANLPSIVRTNSLVMLEKKFER